MDNSGFNFPEIPFLLQVDAQIHPTEIEERVTAAITNIFPDIELQVRTDWISSKTENWDDLLYFSELLEKQRVLDAARRMVLDHLSGNTTRFLLNKQAAYVGKINFCETEEESPMGPLFVVLSSEQINELLDRIVPKWDWLRAKRENLERIQ
ncbi:MAG: RNA-binding domain-containing protein [Candidatus Hodarchaeales archaeon]